MNKEYCNSQLHWYCQGYVNTSTHWLVNNASPCIQTSKQNTYGKDRGNPVLFYMVLISLLIVPHYTGQKGIPLPQPSHSAAHDHS